MDQSMKQMQWFADGTLPCSNIMLREQPLGAALALEACGLSTMMKAKKHIKQVDNTIAFAKEQLATEAHGQGPPDLDE